MEQTLYSTEKKPTTQDDLIRLGDELADIDLKLKAVKDERSKVASSYRVKIRELEEKGQALARQRKEGMLEVRFEIEEVPDDSRMMVQILRKGTKEQIDLRPMNEAEKEAARKRKQVTMGFGDDAKTDDTRDTDRPPPPNGKKARGNGKRVPKAKANGSTKRA
jgi:hypothetical protein